MTGNMYTCKMFHLRSLDISYIRKCLILVRTLATKQSDIAKGTEPVELSKSNQLSKGDCVNVSRLITVEDVDKFCELTGDFNTVHTKSRVVHGALLNGLVSGVIGTMLPGPGTVVVSQTLNYPHPCIAPQNVTVTVSITSARKIVCCEYQCQTTNGITVLQGDAKLIVKFPVICDGSKKD